MICASCAREFRHSAGWGSFKMGPGKTCGNTIGCQEDLYPYLAGIAQLVER